MATGSSFIYIGQRCIEDAFPKSTLLGEGAAIKGIEVDIHNFYNQIAKLADPSDGMVAIMEDGMRYRFIECNEKRTRLAVGDAVYELPFKRMDVAKLFSDRMLEEYSRGDRERLYGAPMAYLIADAAGIRERRHDHARRAAFQSRAK